MPDEPASGAPVDEVLPEEDLEDLYENAPCGYLSTLPDGTIVKANTTFLSWTGYRRGDLVGNRRFPDLLTAGGRIFHETHYAPLLRMQGTVRGVAVEVVCADGERLPVLIDSVVKTDANGDPLLVRTAVFDATDRREYEKELVRERQRAEESEARARVLAETLQDSFIPPAPPSIAGFDIGGVYRPAGRGDEVGGDFYEVFETGGTAWAVAVGDVCGKGAEAAGITALARHTIRAAAMRTTQPSEVLSTLNAALLRQPTDRFCTVCYARVRGRQGRFQLTLASGGHPLPIRVAKDGQAESVGRAGSLLGVFDDPLLHDTSVDLRTEDVVVLYTDGVTEGRRNRELFGDERLRAVLAECRGDQAATIARRVADAVVDFQSGLPGDDIAIVVVKVV